LINSTDYHLVIAVIELSHFLTSPNFIQILSPIKMSDIKNFTISIDDQGLNDLKQRLALARFPDELEDAAWDMGAPLSDVKRLVKYWQSDYDWKSTEKELNKLSQFTTTIQCEGFEPLSIHFVHAKSKVEGAIPLLFSHGWPGSFLEATKMLKPLTEGRKGYPAFHVVVPSLPNFGFSEGPKSRGFNVAQYAETMHKLMMKLGYTEYVTQGGKLNPKIHGLHSDGLKVIGAGQLPGKT
jgi:hypothetical protein